MKRLPPVLILFCFSFPFLLLSGNVVEASGNELVLVSPDPETIAIARKPIVSFRAMSPILDEGFLVLLDGDDITGLVTAEQGLYTYIPVAPLPAGNHSLQIFGFFENGESFEEELLFSSRHSELFEEIASTNRLSSTLKTILKKDSSSSDDIFGDFSTDTPYTTSDTYLTSESTVREGEWNASIRANARYYDQNAALAGPEQKGISLIDFLFSGEFQAEEYSARVEIGDTTIEESRNTVDYLTRRGGKASITLGNITLTGFGTLSTESSYEIDGMGFGFNSNDHIIGTSAEASFFEQRLRFKGIYVRGGESENSLGNWSEGVGRKGDVTGIVMQSDFFNQMLTSDFEFDTVNYDGDTGDDIKETYDKAYRIQIGGLIEKYDFELGYKYTGPQYDVVGNQSIVKDWAGTEFSGGVTYPDQSVRLMLNYSWDNVEGDDLFARNYSFSGSIDYQYVGWERFPVSVLFEHNSQRSADEPDGTDPVSLDTNTLTGTVGYNEGSWGIELRSSYSEQDDHSTADNDTRLFTLSAVPSYSSSYFSIMPSWTLNSSTDLTTDVRTDTNTLTMDIYTSFLNDTIIFEIGGTYDWTKTDDNTVDTENSAAYSRLNYRLEQLWWLEDPTIALEYHYNNQKDAIEDSTTRENILTLVLSTALPYSF
ncbi:hypothetical protein [Desulfomarina sp.]